MRAGSIPHLRASLESLAHPVIRQHCLSAPNQSLARRYPARLLRYWFMYQLLLQEARQRGALSICEIGVDRGQMRHFARVAASQEQSVPAPGWMQDWDAVDVLLRSEELNQAGYRQQIHLDLEHDPLPERLQGQYDVVILLHVLEHLRDPEAVLAKVLPCLKPGGIVIGGMPVLPRWLQAWQERRLRRTARPYGHISAFSPQRVHAFGTRFGLQQELCSGAFLLRAKRLGLEDKSWWLRFNLHFGARVPWWPGELYWSFRKPAGAALAPAGVEPCVNRLPDAVAEQARVV